MADVFVSYSRRNVERVGELSGALEASGYSLWWDRRLPSGADYESVIEREIAAAPAVLVAWSASARDSLWVRAEANEALDAGKLVQVTLDGSKLPLPFTMLHFLDFSRWRGERGGSPWSELDDKVGRMLRGESGDAAAAAAAAGAPAPREPALGGLAVPAMLGWGAIGLAALMAIAILAAAAGALPAAQFGTLAALGLALSAILLASVAWMMMRMLAASRR